MNDSKLLKTVSEFRAGLLQGDSPAGECFRVCSPLSSFLSLLHVHTAMLEVWIDTDAGEWGHFVLILPDERIIDPTASQFKKPNGEPMPEVYFGALPEWYKTKAKREPVIRKSRRVSRG